MFAVRRHISFVELMAVIYWFEVERFISVVYATFCRQLTRQTLVGGCSSVAHPACWVVCANYPLICHITRSIDPSVPCTQDATRSEFDPVESFCPYIWPMGIFGVGSNMPKTGEKARHSGRRAVGLAQRSLSLGNPNQGRVCWGLEQPLVMNPAPPLPPPTHCLAGAC